MELIYHNTIAHFFRVDDEIYDFSCDYEVNKNRWYRFHENIFVFPGSYHSTYL